MTDKLKIAVEALLRVQSKLGGFCPGSWESNIQADINEALAASTPPQTIKT